MKGIHLFFRVVLRYLRLQVICRFLTIWILILGLTECIQGQTKLITGRVTDSASRAPLQNVSVTVRDSRQGTITDASGKFSIAVDRNIRFLEFSFTGYHAKKITLTDDSTQQIIVSLSMSFTTLEDVVVNARRTKYHNKNNPAVDLIREVIANKQKNGPFADSFATYQQYEKTQMFTEGPWVRLTRNFALKKFSFFFENVDSTVVPGKSLNSVYLQEVLSNNYYRKSPEKQKKVIVAQKAVDYGPYVDMRGIKGALQYLFNDINIYDNNISAFTMEFVSPIAELAPTFYMYFIRDTTVVNGARIVQLYFAPRNAEDLLFRGSLYVSIDRNYAVTKVELGVSKHANMNYVRNFQLTQEFEEDTGGHYHLSQSDMMAAFSPFPKSPGLFGERKIMVTSVSDSALPAKLFHGMPVDSLPGSTLHSEVYLHENRPLPLSESQEKTYTNADSLLRMKSYKTMMDLATLYFIGYKSAGKFDIGPIRTFYSFNSVQGQRLQFGGRTNYKFSKRFYMDGYIAYGFKDQQFKYKLTGSYSLNNRSVYSYPFNYIQASYLHDIKNPGEEGLFSNGNTFLGSFTRGYNSNWLYSDIFRLSYVHEFGNHISYILGTEYWKQQPAGSLVYVKQPEPQQMDTISNITTGEISLALRWAPNEQFFENKLDRRNIANKFPVFTLQYTKGIEGLYGGEYNFDAIHFNVYKRVFMSALGFSDIRFDAGYLFGTLPFPLLTIPFANRSFFYSGNSYNLMNVEEFVMDHDLSLHLDHYFNGFFFNKIPLLKKLRLREVINAKILFGGLRPENNPETNPNQMLFPTTNGVTSTFAITGTPYIEAGVGIYNIFSFLRIDLIKRFTYLNNPNISTWGILFSSNFNF